ncbi:MAG: PilW family protein [Legionellales bacterium]
MRRQLGFSLSEILISLFLSGIIMTMLIQFYLNSKHQYLKTQKLLVKSFDVQWASALLADSIRRAGFTPCVGIDQLTRVDGRDVSQTISGLIVQNQPHAFIKVSRMSEVFSPVLTIQGLNQLTVPQGILFHQQRPLLIADCIHAEVLQIQRIDKSDFGSYLITLTKPLVFSYTTPAYVGEWLEEKWFIKNNSSKASALYYKSVQTEELTPLIHSLTIKEQTAQGRRLLAISMGLDEDKTHQMVVAVRGSL